MARNIEIEVVPDVSARRRETLARWRNAFEASMFGTLEIDATKLLDRQRRRRLDKRPVPTVTAISVRAISLLLTHHPEINRIVRFGRVYQRKNVNVLVSVGLDANGRDSATMVLYNTEEKSLDEIHGLIVDEAKRIRSNESKAQSGHEFWLKKIPLFLLSHFVRFVDFLLYGVNLDLRFLGIKKDPGGSASISNIGTLGLENGFVPLPAFRGSPPLNCSIGALKDRVVARNKQVVIVPVIGCSITFNHRILDGVHVATMADDVRYFFETDPGLDEIGL